MENNINGLEKAILKTEADIEKTQKAANSVISSLKRFHRAVNTGSLREIKKTIESSEQAISTLQEQFSKTKDGWNFDAEKYITDKAYIREILHEAEISGLKIFEQDDRLYCYPLLILILPDELSVKIDKIKEKRLRPSTLVSHLKALQNKPIRFKPEKFLESLFSAYKNLVRSRGDEQPIKEIVIPLIKIYKLLTLLPGIDKEYSLSEFARDIYILDRSGITSTKDGFFVSLPASTSTKELKNTIGVITDEGKEKKYYGISFYNR